MHAAPAKAPAAAMVQAAHDAHAAQPQPGQAAGSGGSAGGAASACGASQGGVAVPVHHDSGEVGAVQANGEAPAAAAAPAPAPARGGGGAAEAVGELTRRAGMVGVGDERLCGKVRATSGSRCVAECKGETVRRTVHEMRDGII